ncbi:MAG: MazG-like family protein [Bacillota bacterium]|jgi:hypothetical protein
MHSNTSDVDITKNIKIIDWLKAELVSSVGALLKAVVKGSEELILDCLVGIIITAYLLGKRLGITFARIDMNIKSRLRDNTAKEHQVEKWYGDLSSLLKHMEDHRL